MKTFVKSFIKKKLLRKASSKAQSAMEYLMTYGWAILIISVVLAALFQLGVFNPMTFAPKAPPGSCQVFRPNGPGTTSFINLEGVCSGELPQYVAQFGGTSYVQVPNSASLKYYLNGVTFAVWFKLAKTGASMGIVSQTPNPFIDLWYNGNNLRYEVTNPSINGGAACFASTVLASGTWYFAVLTYNTSILDGYLNGQLACYIADNAIINPNPNPVIIGSYYGSFNGTISNVQIYNTSLSANEIQALYLEGIGGAPIDLQHLVAWWPLNGNANDYSGNGNNGQINGNVNFVSNWYNGYTPP